MEFDLWAQLPSVLPELGLTALAIAVLFADCYGSPNTRRNVVYLSAVAMALLALVPLIWLPEPALYENGALLWGGMVNYNPLAQIFKVMLLLGGAVTCVLAAGDKGVGDKGEFYLIVIIATLGGMMMASASDLILVFVALETLSIPLYMLASFRRGDPRSAESGMKYFLYGAFASAIMLFGFSLLYGFAGTTNLAAIAESMNSLGDGLVAVMAALVMVVVGFGFKVGAVPFHFWTPDVYEGAPTPVTAFVSVSSKAASFALLLRFMTAVFPADLVIAGVVIQDFWINLLVVISILSMSLGNIVALRQSNIKRLLAYSSIAQAGYTLIGVAALQGADPGLAVASVSFYMFMYIFTNLLVFGGAILFIAKTDTEEISDLAGLNRRSPWLALFMTIGLLSLGGIPPTAGFFGKFFLFQAAVNANLVGLALIAVTNAIIALYYYLVVIKVMYVDVGPDDDVAIGIPRVYGWSLGITALLVILLGTIAVTPIYDWAILGAAGL
ncbi:MAG: NADH-quinone oxidoreductase subunit N [Chloroflexota bacterium]|nr:NADH-quinone oxidoreductase subunit N [Chloroflexota bacterium]MCY3583079.1 NADH-quinone oxidoreductase subunit N [Chloroflexota bacterium]MDE2650687.1 NADH-quinone oxidoreductase subunit N [Chloroflexota bacterium]MXV93850.1 NADH-quinone oxidoreductase subunit N [Chloroflexota bacterium]MXX49804.1 NADH-quinone oxidoreductase subunit N [Chloroflexota bacterium]